MPSSNSQQRRPGPRARGYDRKWEARRAEHLRLHPWCVACAEEGRRIRAVAVDHRTPHRGSRETFERSPLDSLCTDHHNRRKQQQERRGYHGDPQADGMPSDPAHPWLRAAGP